MRYKFSGYILDTEQKTLSFSNAEVSLTKKSYQLLLFLLENPNRPLSREEIANTVWQNRVVTDNTIDQCLSKLRKSLNSANPGEYIKSIYGHGVSFLPQVVVVKKPSNSKKILTTAAISFLLIMGLSYFLFQSNHQNSDIPKVEELEEALKTVKKLNVSFLPTNLLDTDVPSESQWFFDGAMMLLNEMLVRQKYIDSRPAKKEWLQEQNKQLLAIDLINKSELDVVAFNDFRFDGQYYIGTLSLRNQNGIFATNSFRSKQIQPLMQQISDWLQDALDIPSQASESLLQSKDLSSDEYALESYIRALGAQQKGDNKKAITFLQVAVEQDESFQLAWYRLAISHRQQGNYDKAMSILNSLNPTTDSLAYKVELVKGQTYGSRKDFTKAQEAYTRAYDLAVKMQDTDKIPSVLVSQAISYIYTKDLVQAEKALQESLTMTNKESQPYFYGILMNNFAKLRKFEFRFKDAIEYSYQAIDAFQRSGDKGYEMVAKSQLASLLIRQADFARAEELSLESLAYSKQQNRLRSISSNHFKLAMIYHQTGRFQLSKQHWLEALELNAKLGIADEKAQIYAQLVNLHLDFNDLQTAESFLLILTDFQQLNSTDTITYIHSEAQLKVAIYQKDITHANSLISKIQVTDPSKLKMYQGQLAKLQKHYLDAESHFLAAIEEVKNSGDFIRLSNLMNELNALYLVIDINKAERSIHQTEQYQPFVYPFMKYKAQLYYQQGRSLPAITLLQELKLKANDFWKAEDQLLLESFQGSS